LRKISLDLTYRMKIRNPKLEIPNKPNQSNPKSKI